MVIGPVLAALGPDANLETCYILNLIQQGHTVTEKQLNGMNYIRSKHKHLESVTSYKQVEGMISKSYYSCHFQLLCNPIRTEWLVRICLFDHLGGDLHNQSTINNRTITIC